MLNKVLQWFGIALIVAVGLIHLYVAPGEFGEALYMGLLFLANLVGAIVAAYGIFRARGANWGWALGLLIAVGSITGYIVSRTVGMPGMEVEEWSNPIGIASLIAEALFIVVAGIMILIRRSAATDHSSPAVSA